MSMLQAKEVARILGVTDRVVYGWVNRGQITHYRFAGCIRFEREDVDAIKAMMPKPREEVEEVRDVRTLRAMERLRLSIPAERRPPSWLSEQQQLLAEKRYRNLRMPPWADREAIRAIYAAAKRLTKETGIPHQVDHVIPLQGHFVSGLHVETNLQILARTENIRKKNRFEVE